MEFAPFDRRGYPTLPVRDGYREWAETYEDVVQDEMDLRLLARIGSVDWAGAGRVLDLACGTGRIGAWLRAPRRAAARRPRLHARDAGARAQAKGVYDRLIQADMLATGLRAAVIRSGARGPGGRASRGAMRRSTGKRRGSPRRQAPSSSSATIRTSS